MNTFDLAVEEVYAKDNRYSPDAYQYLREVLDFAVKRIVEAEGQSRHISGSELMFSFRDYTLQEFGPMSHPLLKEWGIKKTLDVGEMIFNLIEVGEFSKEEGDSLNDFKLIYTFKEAFDEPFLP